MINILEIKPSPLNDGAEFSRGVFASIDIEKGQLIHVAPVIPYPNRDHVYIEKTIFADYVFEYGINHTALVLGYGSLFNHSYTPNANYIINFENHTFEFYAYTDIKAGEEVLINYNGDVDIDDPLWFDKDQVENDKV